MLARDGNGPDLSVAGGILEGIAMGDLGFGEVFRRLYEGSMMAVAEKLYLFYASDKCFAQFFPGDVERLGEHASLACDSHEIGITNPSRKSV
jgi:hypothetical protein